MQCEDTYDLQLIQITCRALTHENISLPCPFTNCAPVIPDFGRPAMFNTFGRPRDLITHVEDLHPNLLGSELDMHSDILLPRWEPHRPPPPCAHRRRRRPVCSNTTTSWTSARKLRRARVRDASAGYPRTAALRRRAACPGQRAARPRARAADARGARARDAAAPNEHLPRRAATAGVHRVCTRRGRGDGRVTPPASGPHRSRVLGLQLGDLLDGRRVSYSLYLLNVPLA
ncbi:hypothetical protein B0H10DRAFT_918253 [Mycena sp. CBHHK59/15]|nr:hypothetical protein B0H10DRAFT_918253 [Mycena sp. CBHHK59/15]